MATALKMDNYDSGLSARNFEVLSKFIYDYSGIKMPSTKKTMLEGRLRKRLRSTGMDCLNDYCDFLFKHGGLETEVVYLIDCVTTNKTDFFREPNHFDFMVRNALPTLAGNGVRTIRTWSSACSTGAEPYTIAMLLAEFAQGHPGMDYKILATDLSTDVLKKAHAGVYAEELLQPVPSALMKKYVMRAIDKQRREMRIVPALRSKVAFARFNLMDPTYSVGDPFHIIFCRNVLIYFDKQTQSHVLKELCKNLVPGGYLFIGHSESIAGIDLPVVQVANTVFQKQ